MSEVACPQCGLSIAVVPNLAGQAVACPQCQFHFIMPGEPEQSAPFISVYQSSASQKLRPAKSLLEIFDFRFEAFVTPIIIRTTWVLVLIGASLYAARGLYEAIEPETKYELQLPDFGNREPTIQAPTGSKTTSAEVKKASPSEEEVKAVMKRSRMISKLVSYCFQLIGLALTLLWIRVGLEMTIVAFNIATSLQSIDRKTKG